MKVISKVLNRRQHLVFLDFEGTQFSHEMIAYGAVMVTLKKDGSIRRIHKGIKGYVLPKNKIGKVVIDLTKITEEILEEKGVSFLEALKQIHHYCGKRFDNVLFVTFGEHDMRILNQSAKHSKEYDVKILKRISRYHFDLSQFLNTYIKDEKGNSYSLENYLKVFNLEFEGNKHDPLADAINLARLYNAFVRNKKIVAEQYKKVLLNNKKLPPPLHELLQELVKEQKVTLKDFDKLIDKFLD